MSNTTAAKKFSELPENLTDDLTRDEIKFDISKLNDTVFKKIVVYYDSITSSPLEFILTGLLSSISGAVGKNVYYSITESIRVYLNIWAVLIGTSTITKKTTAINQCTKELHRISTKSYHEWKDEYKRYQGELSEAKEKKIKFEKPVPVRNYYVFPNDSTIESLSDILSYSSRGLIIHSEFGSFLQQLNRSYSGDSKQFLTTIYDVPESYEVSRATKQNTLIERPFISIVGASTIDWVKENSTPSDLRTGFLARFLYSIRNRPDKNKAATPFLRLGGLTDRSEHYLNVREIFDYLTSINKPFEMKIDSKAVDLHCEFDTNNYYEMLNCTNESELSFKGRLIVYALKFAGLIALTERRNHVTVNDMKDAIHIADYFKRNVERLLNREINQTEFSRIEDKILDIIQRKGGEIQHSQLLQLSNLKKKELEEVISNLIDKEIIEVIQKKVSNRSAKFYKTKQTES